jgi:hypothetical protein
MLFGAYFGSSTPLELDEEELDEEELDEEELLLPELE